MINGLERHELNLSKGDWKCFNYLCQELGMKPSKRIRQLIEIDLKEHEEIILQAMEKQKVAIEKRKKKNNKNSR